jgi:Ran GTPase-activating protein (RanGAP) involved in mRNA processing and transport
MALRLKGKNRSLTCLDLGDNVITRDALKPLATVLDRCVALCELRLGGCTVDDDLAAFMGKWLPTAPSFTCLTISVILS